MGSGFVRRLLAEGHTVHVWNRSPASAKALESHGAKAFAALADAVTGVDRVHLSRADDASVDAVLEPLAGVIPASCWIIDHTTTMPSATGERARRWTGRGRVYLHAPVFMGPVNAAEGTGVMLLSGDPPSTGSRWISRLLMARFTLVVRPSLPQTSSATTVSSTSSIPS